MRKGQRVYYPKLTSGGFYVLEEGRVAAWNLKSVNITPGKKADEWDTVVLPVGQVWTSRKLGRTGIVLMCATMIEKLLSTATRYTCED